MLMYSWKLTVPVVILVLPLLLVVGKLQAGFSVAYTDVRTRVGEMLSEVSESVMGAAVVRAYGLDETVDRRVKRAIGDRYRAQMVAHRRASTLFPISVMFWALALASVVVVGAIYGRSWGLTIGRTTAFLFLAQLFLDPFSDLPARSTARPRPRSRDGARSCRCWTCRWRSRSRRPASSCRAAPSRSRRTTCDTRTPAATGCCTASPCECQPAPTWPSWARPGAARRRSRSC